METVKIGDFSVRLPRDYVGVPGKVADAFNEIVAANQQMAEQLARVGLVVGRQGETRHRVRFAQSQGSWGAMENSVNRMIDDLRGRPPRLRMRSPRSPAATCCRPSSSKSAGGR